MVSYSLNESVKFDNVIVGRCLTMCSNEETKMREENKLLHRFEIQAGVVDSKRRPVADPKRVVKAFSRPAAGKIEPNPYEIRPHHILQMTVDYLVSDVVCYSNCHWADVYDFIFDRLRAVRQDMVMQDISGIDAISILEKIVRFHIYAGYRLCMEPLSVFDAKINEQHTQECLKRLLQSYSTTEGPHINRPEFESIYLLFNLGSGHAMTHYVDLPKSLRENKSTSLCYEICRSYMLGNYVRVLRSLQNLPSVICMCAVHRHLHNIQSKALLVMSVGFSSKNLKYPLDKLTDLLAFNCIAETRDMCRSFSISLNADSISFLKTNYKEPSTKILPVHSDFISDMLERVPLSELLLQTSLREHTVPHTMESRMSARISDMSIS